MKTIEVTSAKIRSGMFLTVSYEESNELKTETKDFTRNDDIVNKSDLPMHSDCAQAFLNLLPHFALICEVEKPNKAMKLLFDADVDSTMEDEEYISKKYTIEEFIITGSGDSQGLVIKGTKFLSTGKTIKLVTPTIRLDDDNDYKILEELNKRVDQVKEEVFQYLQGKHAPFAQQSMDFDDEGFDAADINVMGVDEDDDDFDIPANIKDPKEIMQDLKTNLRKSGMTMTISSSEDKGAA